jgi:hypothetical protein
MKEQQAGRISNHKSSEHFISAANTVYHHASANIKWAVKLVLRPAGTTSLIARYTAVIHGDTGGA